MDFKVYQSIQELLLKAVAGEDHDEELAKVMAMYGDTDLQQYKPESQLSLLPEVVQAINLVPRAFSLASSKLGKRPWERGWQAMGGTTPPDSTSLICWTFFSHSEMLANSY